jgi:hypothetical protein
MNARALYIGTHANALKPVLSLREAGFEPVLLNAHTRLFPERLQGVSPPVEIELNLFAQLGRLLPRYSRFAFPLLPQLALRVSGLERELARVSERTGPVSFILAHYGTPVLPELALIKASSAYRDVPVVLNMEVLPTAWRSSVREAIEYRMLRATAPLIDAVVVPNREVGALLREHVPQLWAKPRWEKPWYLARCFAPRVPSTPSTRMGERDLIFVGWLDYVRSLNDVRSQLLSLCAAGFAVECSATEGVSHPNLSFFERFNYERFANGDLLAYMQTFKACVVTYNYAETGRIPTRFASSIPTRFITAMSAGVPILLPRGRFPAMQRIVEEHEIGFAYASGAQAWERVSRSDWTEVRANSERLAREWIFDGADFRSFVERTLG